MKKTMKKWHFSVVLLTLIMAFTFVHAAVEIHFTDHECKVGDEVIVTFNISEPINSGQITLSFSSDTLEFVSLKSEGLDSSVNVEGNSIFIATATISDAELHSVSYTLKMRATNAGTGKIVVSEAKFSDGLQNPIAAGSHGSATITILSDETQPTETQPTEPPTTVHEHNYSVREVLQTNYKTTDSRDGKYTIYWDQVRYNCTCGEAFGDKIDEENHREEKPTEPPTERQKSSEARLKSLNLVGGGSLSPAFNPDIYQYRMELDPETSYLQVRYELMDEYATGFYWPYVNDVPVGETHFVVRVTSEDKSKQNDYRVTIVRPGPAPTDPPVTTEEETTTEENATEETTTEPETTTEEESTTDPRWETPAVILLEPESRLYKILPMPADLEIPAGYVLTELTDAYGRSYEVLLPEGESLPDHHIVYAVPLREIFPETESEENTENTEEEQPETTEVSREFEEIGEPDFYIVDRIQGSVQRYGLIRQPETTTASETTTEEETTTVAPATQPPTTPAPTATAPSRASAEGTQPAVQKNGVSWWVWLALLLIFTALIAVIVLLIISKDKLEKQMQGMERLSGDEEEAFLAVNNEALLEAAKAANPPVGSYSMEDLEDLDAILDQKK